MCLSRSGFSEAEARARSCGAESMAETFGYFMLHVYTILAPALGFGEARATGFPTELPCAMYWCCVSNSLAST